MTTPNSESKTCLKCNNVLPTEEFYIQRQKSEDGSTTWDYFDCYCKKCRNKTSLERRKNIKKEAVEYKGGKCEHCGIQDDCLDIYDFHHVDPTQKDFAIARSAKAFKNIKNELDKCQLLCANCHRKVHSSQ